MSNVIKIKRSTTQNTPSSLSQGELAYSESSQNLFVGVADSGIEKIGGNADVTKLASIEANATADQTGAEIKTAYESETNTNAFTDTLKTKLEGVDSSANNYSLPASVVHDTEKGALHATDALRISGHTVSLYKGDGTSESVIIPDNNTTYSVGDGGLTQKNFTTTLKNKLDGVAASANNYSLPASVVHDTELSSSISSTSTTTAANSAAVKAAYDQGSHSHPYLGSSHAASGVTSTKLTAWDAAATWHSTMTSTDTDNIINTVSEIVTTFQSHAEDLNLITELDSKLTASSTIDGGTF
jgi:hypothetical protein